jgi:hypothetical protein
MRLDRGAPDRLGAMDRAGSLTTWTVGTTPVIYNIPLSPSADLSIWDTGLPANLMSVRVHQKMGDRVSRADLEFAGRTIGGVASTLYGQTFLVKLPDHLGNSQIVFNGAFRSSASTYSPTRNSETMPAFGQEWYLNNPLGRSQLSLLTPVQQQAKTTYRLYLRSGIMAAFKAYDWVLGGTSGAAGMVTDLQLYGYPWIEMTSVTGTFVDGEELYVGTVAYAYADGHAVDVTGTVVVIYPDRFIRDLLGGDEWAHKTGINPYRIQSPGSSVWGNNFAIPFRFSQGNSKISAIETITKKLNYLHLVKLSDTGEPLEYDIDETLIDDPTVGLDLPDPVTFVKNSPYLAAPITLDINGDAQYNMVTLRCMIPSTGVWYEASLPATEPEKPVIYVEVTKDIATISEANDRLAALYAYYSAQVRTWTAIFCARTDLRYLQKLTFTGNSPDIPDGDYRIIDIDYYYADGGRTNLVTCKIVSLVQFKAYLAVNRVSFDALKAVRALAAELLDQQQKITRGTAVTVNTDGTVVTEDGLGVSTSGRDAAS